MRWEFSNFSKVLRSNQWGKFFFLYRIQFGWFTIRNLWGWSLPWVFGERILHERSWMHKITQQSWGDKRVILGKRFNFAQTLWRDAITADIMPAKETGKFKMRLFYFSFLLDSILLHFPLFWLITYSFHLALSDFRHKIKNILWKM